MRDSLIGTAKKGLTGMLGYIFAGLVAAVFALMGIFFLWQGLATRLVPEMGVPGAFAVSGGLALLLAGFIALGIYLVARRGSPDHRSTPEQETSEQALELGFMAVDVLRDQVKAHPGQATLVALVAGAVLGANPQLARTFVDATRHLGKLDKNRDP